MQNYWRQVELTRLAMEMVTIFGGKAPHTHGIVVGGATVHPTADNIRQFTSLLLELQSFIKNELIPDNLRLGEIYPEYYHYGNSQDFLTFANYPGEIILTNKSQSGGAWLDGAIRPFDEKQILEHLRYSWYRDNAPLHPAAGETEPDFEKEQAYSWVKAPRYAGKACEVGPLAKMWISDKYRNGTATMDRTIARSLEALTMAELMQELLLALEPGKPVFQPFEVPQEPTEGVGLIEAFRGCLGHWVATDKGRIASYQIVTPSAWNCSPRDDDGQRGPIEAALIGLPVQNIEEPVEVGRVVRSFDPCLSCAIH